MGDVRLRSPNGAAPSGKAGRLRQDPDIILVGEIRDLEAADGAEALTLLRLGVGFDLMVLDVDMPEVGGPEVLREVRQTARTAALPVIVLTGDPDPETEVWLLELGADDFIRKPLEPTTFSMRVQGVLRRARG